LFSSWLEKNLVANPEVTIEEENEESILQENLGSEEILSEIEYEVVTRVNGKNDRLTDVYIKDVETGNEIFFASILDVYFNHYHHVEYNNGNIYIIKRIGYDGYPDEDWTDELWKYDSNRVSNKLYSTKGLDFRVSPDGKLIALQEGENLLFLETDGTFLKKFPTDVLGSKDISSPDLNLLDWSNDSNLFWGDLSFTVSPELFFAINTELWSIERYDVRDLNLTISDLALNYNNGKLAYSDFPALFDNYSYDDFMNSESEVTLKIYDLKTKEEQEIAVSITKKFEPEWIAQDILEYNNPDSDDRIQFELELTSMNCEELEKLYEDNYKQINYSCNSNLDCEPYHIGVNKCNNVDCISTSSNNKSLASRIDELEKEMTKKDCKYKKDQLLCSLPPSPQELECKCIESVCKWTISSPE